MAWDKLFALTCAFLFVRGAAFAASVDVTVMDSDGKPAMGAVVSLAPVQGAAPEPSRLPAEAIIDQRHQMFIPLAVIVRRGGHVVFTNNDTTMHQVYSFSPIKQFEFEIDQGHKSEPVVFDKPGVAAIGCNIHDNMLAFVYVADSPWTAMTDGEGRAHVANVPNGAYTASAWHPRLAPGAKWPSAPVKISGDSVSLSLSAPLMADTMSGMKHMHSQDY
jgi:plastocyanin